MQHRDINNNSNEQKQNQQAQQSQQKKKQKSFKKQQQQQQELQQQDQDKRVPKCIKDLLKSEDYLKIYEETDYDLIQFIGKARILQSKSNPLCFKLFIQLPFSQDEIASVFLDTDCLKNWNQSIEYIKVLQIIDNDSLMIIQEIRKAFGVLYKSREFIYERCSFTKNGTIYIYDHSVDFEINDSSSINSSLFSILNKGKVQGNIDKQIISIAQNPNVKNSSLLTLYLNLTNNGYITNQQDANITLFYLSSFVKLKEYLSQKEFHNLNAKKYAIQIFNLDDDAYKKQQKLKEEQYRKLAKNILGSNFDDGDQNEENKDGTTANTMSVTQKKNNNYLLAQMLFQNEFFKCIPQITKEQEDSDLSSNQEDQFESNDQSQQRNFEKLNQDLAFSKELSRIIQEPEETQEVDKTEMILTDLQVVDQLEVIEKNLYTLRCIVSSYIMAPITLYQSQLQRNINNPNEEHYALPASQWQDNPKGGLICTDKVAINNQKNVFKFLIKKIGSNLIQGKSIINISMPITIFDTQSGLERIASQHAYASTIFGRAGTLNEPLDQLKEVILYQIMSLHLALRQAKPFNPILGETFQARINGDPIYLEQICHHPPISAMRMYGQNYIFGGQWELIANMHPNSITGKVIGLHSVQFLNNDTEVSYFKPDADITGFLYGNRLLNYFGKGGGFDLKNQLYYEFQFDPDKKGFVSKMFGGNKQQRLPDFFVGSIFKVTKAFTKKLLLCKKTVKNFNKFSTIFNPKEDIVETIGSFEGVWHKFLDIDGQRKWNFEDIIAHQIVSEKNPLPSDCIYRKDAIIWKSKDTIKAQSAKEELENIQRKDRKLRDEWEKKKSKQ